MGSDIDVHISLTNPDIWRPRCVNLNLLSNLQWCSSLSDMWKVKLITTNCRGRIWKHALGHSIVSAGNFCFWVIINKVAAISNNCKKHFSFTSILIYGTKLPSSFCALGLFPPPPVAEARRPSLTTQARLPLTAPHECHWTPCKPRWRRCSWAPRKTSSWWSARSRPRRPWSHCNSWTWWKFPWSRRQTERCRRRWGGRPCCSENTSGLGVE